MTTRRPGRPPKYRPEMCEEMLELMSNGAKDSWIYAHFGICKDTFYEWIRTHDEFKKAHDEGLALCEIWWEKKGMDLMNNGDNKAFNYWIAFMNRKFGWSNRSSGEGGTNIHINNMNVLQHAPRNELLDSIKAKILDEPELLDILEIDHGSERSESEDN